jgi:hypothetical protein
VISDAAKDKPENTKKLEATIPSEQRLPKTAGGSSGK